MDKPTILVLETATYAVADGVEWVDGRPVPDSREVTLTAAQAQFDLDQGRIRPKDEIAAADEKLADEGSVPSDVVGYAVVGSAGDEEEVIAPSRRSKPKS